MATKGKNGGDKSDTCSIDGLYNRSRINSISMQLIVHVYLSSPVREQEHTVIFRVDSMADKKVWATFCNRIAHSGLEKVP